MRRLGFRLRRRLFCDICEARSGSDKLNRGRIYAARDFSGIKGLVLRWWLAWLGLCENLYTEHSAQGRYILPEVFASLYPYGIRIRIMRLWYDHDNTQNEYIWLSDDSSHQHCIDALSYSSSNGAIHTCRTILSTSPGL